MNVLLAVFSLLFCCHAHCWRSTCRDEDCRPFLFLVSFEVTMEAEADMTTSAEASFGPLRNPCVRGCLYVWVVRSYCYADNACLVSVGALYCIFIVLTAQSPLQDFLDARPLHPMPNGHRATQAHPPSQQGHSANAVSSTYLLSDSQHSLQLRCSYSWM